MEPLLPCEVLPVGRELGSRKEIGSGDERMYRSGFGIYDAKCVDDSSGSIDGMVFQNGDEKMRLRRVRDEICETMDVAL